MPVAIQRRTVRSDAPVSCAMSAARRYFGGILISGLPMVWPLAGRMLQASRKRLGEQADARLRLVRQEPDPCWCWRRHFPWTATNAVGCDRLNGQIESYLERRPRF